MTHRHDLTDAQERALIALFDADWPHAASWHAGRRFGFGFPTWRKLSQLGLVSLDAGGNVKITDDGRILVRSMGD